MREREREREMREYRERELGFEFSVLVFGFSKSIRKWKKSQVFFRNIMEKKKGFFGFILSFDGLVV